MTRWCDGPCGRELPMSQFEIDGMRVERRRVCRGCRRVRAAENRRKRYHRDREARARILSNNRAWRHRNVKRLREYQRGRDLAKKLRGVAA